VTYFNTAAGQIIWRPPTDVERVRRKAQTYQNRQLVLELLQASYNNAHSSGKSIILATEQGFWQAGFGDPQTAMACYFERRHDFLDSAVSVEGIPFASMNQNGSVMDALVIRSEKGHQVTLTGAPWGNIQPKEAGTLAAILVDLGAFEDLERGRSYVMSKPKTDKWRLNVAAPEPIVGAATPVRPSAHVTLVERSRSQPAAPPTFHAVEWRGDNQDEFKAFAVDAKGTCLFRSGSDGSANWIYSHGTNRWEELEPHSWVVHDDDGFHIAGPEDMKAIRAMTSQH